MSVEHSTDIGNTRQDDLAELKRIELQIMLGAITRRSLCRVMRCGPHTVDAWIKTGNLQQFRPATGEAYFRPDDIRDFMAGRPTISGTRPTRKKKK